MPGSFKVTGLSDGRHRDPTLDTQRCPVEAIDVSEVRWLPVNGARHAMRKEQHRRPLGTEVMALCGEAVTLSRPNETDWFWDSCPKCWSVAKIMNSEPTFARTLHRL